MSGPDRGIHARASVGAAAHVLQGRGLEVLRVHVDQCALILVDRGIKAVRTERGAAVRAQPGQAIVLAGNQRVDFTNTVTTGTHYEARWLLFDAALLNDAYYLDRCNRIARRRAAPAYLVRRVTPHLAAAFDNASRALAPLSDIPDAIARQRLLEVLHWLLEEGIALAAPAASTTFAARIRTLVAGSLHDDWTSRRIAGALALSEPTLRRRLAAEETSLTAVLTDARMSTALALLQATAQPVADIALAVGYDSPSRFAVRFRQRFGFAPTAVRGHERARPST